MLNDRELEARQRVMVPAAFPVDLVCFWLAALSALGVIIGAVGPWATAWGVAPLSGTGMHGWREVAVGVVALALLAVHPRCRRGRPLALILTAIDGTIGAAGAAEALSKINANGALLVFGFHYRFLSPAWGVYLVLGGGIVLAGCGSVLPGAPCAPRAKPETSPRGGACWPVWADRARRPISRSGLA